MAAGFPSSTQPTSCFTCERPHPHTPTVAAERLAPPRCAHCGGPVRPCVVWFGEALPEAAWQQACAAVEAADLVLVVGTSGLVQPAASLPALARRAGATVAEINPVPGAAAAQPVWRAAAAGALPQLG